MAGKRKNRDRRDRHLKPLPNCEGPKLHPFTHSHARIEWLERLDAERASHSGPEGYVFKVRIESRIYALKVVSCPLS
jgi:hypothetical protein